jgi:hypothetical protein
MQSRQQCKRHNPPCEWLRGRGWLRLGSRSRLIIQKGDDTYVSTILALREIVRLLLLDLRAVRDSGNQSGDSGKSIAELAGIGDVITSDLRVYERCQGTYRVVPRAKCARAIAHFTSPSCLSDFDSGVAPLARTPLARTHVLCGPRWGRPAGAFHGKMIEAAACARDSFQRLVTLGMCDDRLGPASHRS